MQHELVPSLRRGRGLIVKHMKLDSAGVSPLVPSIAPIACTRCGNPAHLIRRTPDAQMGGKIETRTFECCACLELTSITVEH